MQTKFSCGPAKELRLALKKGSCAVPQSYLQYSIVMLGMTVRAVVDASEESTKQRTFLVEFI